MDEQILAQLRAMGISEEDLNDPEKVKALAEKVELENKEKKEDKSDDKKDDKSKEILNNQLERLAKAIAKRTAKIETKSESSKSENTLTELDIDNRVYIKANKLSEDKVKVLEELSQLPSNKDKSFEEIAESTPAKAQFQEIDESLKATDELDANADEETILNTRNEIKEKYSKTDKEPTSEYEKKIVATGELEDAGFKEY